MTIKWNSFAEKNFIPAMELLEQCLRNCPFFLIARKTQWPFTILCIHIQNSSLKNNQISHWIRTNVNVGKQWIFFPGDTLFLLLLCLHKERDPEKGIWNKTNNKLNLNAVSSSYTPFGLNKRPISLPTLCVMLWTVHRAVSINLWYIPRH